MGAIERMDYRGVLSIILGGGKGTRLFPLTEQRSKPAVPFGGKYRLVDIPISNCINAGLRHIYILTQFNSASLHNHINLTYSFDSFSGGFVEVLAAEQTPDNESWYSGTADAVRKNFSHFHAQSPQTYLILSGDQLYRMSVPDLLAKHHEVKSELTIATIPVNRQMASSLGIVRVDKNGVIRDFLEKPSPDRDISFMKLPQEFMLEHGLPEDKEYLASMGIYVFNRGILEQCLDNDKTDFGSEVIPESIGQIKMHAYLYKGYWEDVGTITSFYESNLDLTTPKPSFNLYDASAPLYAHKLDLPPSKLNSCDISHSLTAEGSIITESTIRNSIIGVRSIIQAGSNLDGVISMGSDYYETEEQQKENVYRHVPNMGIGTGNAIRKAIIDKNARIGNNCRIGVDAIHRSDGDYGSYMICGGIIVIRKNALIPNGSII